MGATITITKVDDKNFNIAFSQEMTGPSGVGPGGEVPLEWMRAILDYYNTHQGPDGSVPTHHIGKVIGFW